MPNDNNPNYKIINNQQYFFKIRLWNTDGDEMIMNPEGVLQLVIEDDLHFWVTKGFLVYENPFEILERKMAPDDTGNDGTQSRAMKKSSHYNFRNDGRDFLDVTIRPILEDSTTNEPEANTLPITDLDPELWELKYTFVVYDKEDLEVQNITQKMKKLYFWDSQYQKMLDKKIQWSSATSDRNAAKRADTNYDPSLATDAEREMFTGDVVRDILETNGFEVDDERFDIGSSSVFYTSFHDQNIWESIDYNLDDHMSKSSGGVTDTVDISLFKKDRYTNKFELEPLHKIFEKAGSVSDDPKEYQIEHFFFDETVGLGTPSVNKAPMLDSASTTTDVKMTKIKKYQYVDMSSIDSTNRLVTMPVHAYDNKNKTFSINIEESNIEYIQSLISKVYIENKLLSNNGSHPLLSLNKDKTENQTISPVGAHGANKRSIYSAGLGKLLYNSIFLNNCIVINVDGATIRRTGRFIGLDRLSFSDDKFDYKLCGQWLTTKVSHNFFHNMYTNEVTGVKMHSYDTLNVDDTVA